MLGEKKNKTQNLSNWKAEKQYKAKWNMENLEKSQRPAIKKASVWNGLVIHMPTERVWAKVFHEVFCSSDGQWFSKSMLEHEMEWNCNNQNPIIIWFGIGTSPHSRFTVVISLTLQ